jgi:hypothetical protein
MALLLIVLAGMYVLRRNGGGKFGLARLLWKQVGWRFSAAISLGSFNFDIFFFSRGSFGLYLAPQLTFHL